MTVRLCIIVRVNKIDLQCERIVYMRVRQEIYFERLCADDGQRSVKCFARFQSSLGLCDEGCCQKNKVFFTEFVFLRHSAFDLEMNEVVAL